MATATATNFASLPVGTPVRIKGTQKGSNGTQRFSRDGLIVSQTPEGPFIEQWDREGAMYEGFLTDPDGVAIVNDYGDQVTLRLTEATEKQATRILRSWFEQGVDWDHLTLTQMQQIMQVLNR